MGRGCIVTSVRGLRAGVAIKWAAQKEQQHPWLLVDEMAWESKREDLGHRASWRVRAAKKA